MLGDMNAGVRNVEVLGVMGEVCGARKECKLREVARVVL